MDNQIEKWAEKYAKETTYSKRNRVNIIGLVVLITLIVSRLIV